MMEYFNIFTHVQGWIYLLILTLLEIVLGIDNIIFISIVTDRLTGKTKRKARNLGLSLALIVRIFLLTIVSWIMQLTAPLFVIFEQEISGQDLVLLTGGLFLIYKSTVEMHNSIKGHDEASKTKGTSFRAIVLQIVLIDIVFSFDSVISAIGMTNGIQVETHSNPLAIIFASVIISMVIMLLFAKHISMFISANPTVKMIALSFLVTIGVLLVAEAFDQDIPKGYVYFALVYSLLVEMLNIRMRKNKKTSE